MNLIKKSFRRDLEKYEVGWKFHVIRSSDLKSHKMCLPFKQTTDRKTYIFQKPSYFVQVIYPKM